MPVEPSAALIEEELESERGWSRSLEQRALSLFASAGVIASLAGIAARGFEMPIVTRVLLGLGLAALAAGAFLGLWVAYPVLAPTIRPSSLSGALEPTQRDRSAEEHLIRASRTRLNLLVASRAVNRTKTQTLKWAMRCAGAGIVLLLFAVIAVLGAGPGETGSPSVTPSPTATASPTAST